MAALDAGVEQSVLGMSLDLDGIPMKPTRCYSLPAERLTMYVGIVEGIAADSTNVIAVRNWIL